MRREYAPIPCLIGVTASGKSDVGIHAARERGGEVICADAFTAYRGMEILSAAPRAPEDVPHHLVGSLDPSEHWSAASFARECDRRVREIRGRDREPWVVGGSALYLRGWLKGFGAPVGRDEAYRARLEAIAAALGPATLHRLLAEKDAARAKQVHPNDERRIVRALEIIRATGRPASEQRGEWSGADRVPAVLVGLRRSKADLDERIAARVEAMFREGVVEEVRRLLARPVSREARFALGFRDVEAHLAGRRSLAETKEVIVRRTRAFARSQTTFLRSFEGVRWLDVERDEPAEAVARRVVAAL